MSEKTYSLEMTIRTLLGNKRYSSIKDILITLNAADIAAIFAELEPEILPLLFRLLPKELAADTFVEMDPDQQQLLITRFSDTELKEVIDELYIDDAVDLVEEMPANVVKRILTQADPETRKLINELLKYPEDSAGSIMTTEFVELGMGYTVEDAIKTIRRTGFEKETINDCFVTGPGRTLEGIISIRSLILAQDDDKVSDIMDTNVVSVNTMDDQETVAEKFKKYDLTAMPVVDGENRLVGMVTVDDAIDVMEEEATEDIEKMAADAADGLSHLHRPHHQQLRGSVGCPAGPDRLYPHAHGHGRKLRQPGFRHHHPRSQPERDTLQGHLHRHLEGGAGRHPLRPQPVRHQLFEAHVPRQGGHAGVPVRVVDPGGHGDHREVHRLHPAHAGQEAGLRPGGHGQPLHHHGGGCPVPAHLLQHRQGDHRSVKDDWIYGERESSPGCVHRRLRRI